MVVIPVTTIAVNPDYNKVYTQIKLMTLAQGRLAQALINQINSWAIENQDDLEQAYSSEMADIIDQVVINAVKSELGLG